MVRRWIRREAILDQDEVVCDVSVPRKAQGGQVNEVPARWRQGSIRVAVRGRDWTNAVPSVPLSGRENEMGGRLLDVGASDGVHDGRRVPHLGISLSVSNLAGWWCGMTWKGRRGQKGELAGLCHFWVPN